MKIRHYGLPCQPKASDSAITPALRALARPLCLVAFPYDNMMIQRRDCRFTSLGNYHTFFAVAGASTERAFKQGGHGDVASQASPLAQRITLDSIAYRIKKSRMIPSAKERQPKNQPNGSPAILLVPNRLSQISLTGELIRGWFASVPVFGCMPSPRGASVPGGVPSRRAIASRVFPAPTQPWTAMPQASGLVHHGFSLLFCRGFRSCVGGLPRGGF
jgi:hypothetical protein